ncbi:hypothetical protein LDENG_00060040 [Lucifuga dentata]|nr:hypothetical protein LDENG_00060040 [Lucifuga dentata]
MSADGATSQDYAENERDGSERKPCPLYGCKRAYKDTDALENHIKDHEIQAESLPGKVMLCSNIGCSSSFPNMQKLMEHMRHHHKSNIFFLCENCRAKLRSFRGLLTHLHTCSKVPRGKTKPTEQTPPQPPAATNPSSSPMETEEETPWQDSASAPQHLLSPVQNAERSLPAVVSQQDSPAAPLLRPPCSSDQASSQQLMRQLPQLPPQSQTFNPSSYLDAQTATPDQAEGQHLPQTTSPEPVHLAPGSTPHSPPGPTAIWRKNQGSSGSRRILWEHTKGHYRCVQCGYSATNRRDMTSHINMHAAGKAAEEAAAP